MIYGYLIGAVLFLAAVGGAYWQGRTDGAGATQVKWDQAIIAARDAAEEDRKAQQKKAAALSKRYEARIATQARTSKEIASQLEIAIGKVNMPPACVVSDGVRDIINAALAGKSAPAGELPSGAGTAAAAKDRPSQ